MTCARQQQLARQRPQEAAPQALWTRHSDDPPQADRRGVRTQGSLYAMLRLTAIDIQQADTDKQAADVPPDADLAEATIPARKAISNEPQVNGQSETTN